MMVITAVVTMVALGGCSDDDPAAPPGGGNSGFSLPAGEYRTSYAEGDCSAPLGPGTSSTEFWCSDEILDEIGDYSCKPTVVNADTILIDCSGTEVVGDTCTINWTATGLGWREGSKWTLDVQVEFEDNPDGCYPGAACIHIVMSAERVGDPPSACNYADLNTFNSTIGGGPMAGRVPFIMRGSSFSTENGLQWYLAGIYPEPDYFQGSSTVQREGWLIEFFLPPIDRESLPFEAHVVGISDRANSAAQSSGSVYYGENNGKEYRAYSSGGGGTVTVQEISTTHIAGTISLDIEVTESTGPRTSAAQDPLSRTITGGFYVEPPPPPPPTTESLARSLGQRMLRSLRGYVE